jgi:hypothetical protein
MALTSTYVFDQTDLRGNFKFTNVGSLGFYSLSWTWANLSPGSTLTALRPNQEIDIDLYALFNRSDFFWLIDTMPSINGMSLNNNPDSLMVLISLGMYHYGYRTSDVRAGWDMWRHLPYYNQDPARHGDSDLLNQIAFNFHIERGEGTVDNDGWIAFYYQFFLDGGGRLGAFVDGWAYEFGGGGGLPDDAPDLGGVLHSVLPPFVSTIQSFLDPFVVTAGLFQDGEHDSSGRALFDEFYLLPGDGNNDLGPFSGGVPVGPFMGSGARSVDAEATLALVPRFPSSPSPPGPPPPTQIRVRPHSPTIASGIADLSGAEREGKAEPVKGSGMADLSGAEREGKAEPVKGSGMADLSGAEREHRREGRARPTRRAGREE